MILLIVILGSLLFGNWLINLTLIFAPVDLFTRITSFGWWGLGVLGLLFIAWCIGEE
ncbi:MAG: hypothetical protein AAGE96_00170 [Cyanobacteria bacterium P01_G01_bin.19]